MTATDTDDAVVDDPVLDEDWLAAPRRRSRLRLALAATLAAALCFLGGVLVQQQLGTGSASTPAAGGLPSGLPEGFPGVLPGVSGQDAGSAGDPAGSDDSTDSSAVIGTVVNVRGDVWVVEDLGGTRHRVHLADQTDVVRETDADPADVRVGDDVDISGTTHGDLLDAEQVTLR